MNSAHRSAMLLAGLLASAGVGHFVAPRGFDAQIPRSLPGSPRAWTYVSGAAELTVAAAVAHPRTRRVGGLAAAALFVAVFPGNVTMAYRWRHKPAPLRAAVYARLPVQVPLVLWARAVARDAKGKPAG